jgi:hypothetical protein
MNKLLPNGNILALLPVGDESLLACGTQEVAPSDPGYEGCTFFMSTAEEEKALAILAKHKAATAK